ncbi:MAG: ABC transporter substrate-binding protein, partial [Candidatus Dormibacteraeota bacterium]|nr:ABC transporter substrate-binding protein [Candidatus Dormibacteraeota bacterium]
APGSLAAALPEHPVGRTERVGNSTVVVPNDGGPPIADLYSGAADSEGIYNDHVNICSHAALIFGPAFHISSSDLHVFWQNLNAKGGIYGRNVVDTYQDDQYQPGPAVQAAQSCKDQPGGTFFLQGGIGFDQIPAVRQWAETNHMLYLHHMATQNGEQGLRYSFAPLPTIESLGRFVGEDGVARYHGHTFGVIWRNSSNWQGGRDAFVSALRAHGENVPFDAPVNNNQGHYQQEIAAMQARHVDVLMIWENAVASSEIMKEMASQNYRPQTLMASFNLVSQTVGSDIANPPAVGFGAWPAYTCHNTSGPYASYAADIQEFEREYAQYDPGANLCAQGGDLLFLNWAAQKETAQMLLDCGAHCTRNRLAGLLLAGYKKNVSPNCPEDWSRQRQQGSFGMTLTVAYKAPDGNYDFKPTDICKEHL